MKKGLIWLLLILICFGSTSCKKNSNADNWDNTFEGQNVVIDEVAKKIFDEATKDYTDMSFDALTLMGTQVVAGKNYMFLTKGYQKDEEEASYKIVTIYNDLENNSSITNVNNFDYTKYVNVNEDGNFEELAGGWHIDSSNKGVLDERIQKIFDEATSTLTGMTYTPIVVLGKQENNYAILCYGKPSYGEFDPLMYLITLNEKDGIVSQAYIDLAGFNK